MRAARQSRRAATAPRLSPMAANCKLWPLHHAVSMLLVVERHVVATDLASVGLCAHHRA